MIINLFMFEVKKYFHTTKWIVPFIVIILYMAMSFTVAPLDWMSSFSITALFLYPVSIYIGFTIDDGTYEMMDQTIFVKLEKRQNLYHAKALFSAAICFVLSLGIIGYCIISHYIQFLFLSNPSFYDIVFSALLILMSMYCGCLSGQLLNRHIVKSRVVALLVSVTAGVLCITKSGIEHKWPISKVITWVIPPVCDCGKALTGAIQLPNPELILIFIGLAVYCAVLLLSYCFLSNRIRFR